MCYMSQTVQPDSEETTSTSISQEQLEQFVQNKILPVIKRRDGKITKTSLRKHFKEDLDELGMTPERFRYRINQDNLKAELGIAQHENHVEAWADALEEKHGRFRYDQLKKYLDKQTLNPFTGGQDRNRLLDELDSRDNIDYTLSGRGTKSNSPFNIFIKTKEDPFEEHRNRLPDMDNAEEIFDYFLGKGCAPKTIVAGIKYVYRNQKDNSVGKSTSYKAIAEEEDCTGVSVSKLEDRIRDEFDVGGGQ